MKRIYEVISRHIIILFSNFNARLKPKTAEIVLIPTGQLYESLNIAVISLFYLN